VVVDFTPLASVRVVVCESLGLARARSERSAKHVGMCVKMLVLVRVEQRIALRLARQGDK
jgi:hypothetical protein